MRRRSGQLAIAAVVGLAALAWGSEVRVGGGSVRLEGQVKADRVTVAAPATLHGNGTLQGDLEVSGALAPGGYAADAVGTQRVQGAVTFLPGSRFLCYAATHTNLDRLEASGAVSGSGQVVCSQATGAIPVGAVIVRGGAASSFAGFSPDSTWRWRLGTTGAVDLVLTDLRGDSDSDGLPDWWELAHFAGRTAGAPDGNPDGDRMNNGAEYAANTIPTDGNSVFEITDLAVLSATNARVRWTTTEGRQYTVVTWTNLLGGAPTTAAVLTVYSQPAHSWTDTVSAAQTLIYGVKVQEQP